MAIAPLMEYEGLPDGSCGLLERPWPRAVLRVVSPVAGDVGTAVASGADHDEPAVVGGVAPVRWRQTAGSPLGRHGEDVALRRARRAAAVRRRRRLLLATAVAGLVTLLALPLSALGGASPAQSSVRATGATVTGATVYVVQPGDTLWSIAERFDHGGNPRPLVEAIARETRSATVVPGERIDIP